MEERITREELLERLFHDDYENLKGKKLRLTRVRVPGKSLDFAHVFTPSDGSVYENLALHIGVHEGEDHRGETIGIMRVTPWEAIVVATDVAVKAAQLKLYYYLKVVTAMAAGDATGIQESQMCYAGIPDTKCTYPSKAELAMWIEQRAAAQMAEALKKAVPDKKEHPIRISIITLVLAYSTFFYGLWYGIKRDMGYEVRYRFAEISITVITISLAVLLIWEKQL